MKKYAARFAETALLRELVLESTPRRSPVPAAEIFQAVRDTYGSIGERKTDGTRRLWRALAWLRDQGFIRRPGFAQGYTRVVGELAPGDFAVRPGRRSPR